MLPRRRESVEEEDRHSRLSLVEPPVTGAGPSMLLTLAGAAGLIVSAFLEWIRPEGIDGSRVGARAFFDTAFTTSAPFLKSAGFAAIILGLVAIAGLTFRTGWITRLAGALGIIAFALFAITLHRMHMNLPAAIGVGLWVMLGASLLALFGGLFATRPRVIYTQAPAAS